MDKIEKVIIGIDVSKDSFDVCCKVLLQSKVTKVKGSHKFRNDQEGFQAFESWITKRIKDKDLLQLVMEATGVYYENLSYYFYERDFHVCVLLANKSKNYARSLNIKSKTDKIDASLLATMGIERILPDWQPMSPSYKILRDMVRLYLSYKKQLNRVCNQLHAMKHAHNKSNFVVVQQEQLIAFYKQAIADLEKELLKEVKKDNSLYTKIKQLETIPGLGFITAIIVITEANGFVLFENIQQLVSYSGLDAKHNESGGYKGKTRISKKGNSQIRHALFMPAMSAIQHNKPIKDLYIRISEKNPTMKRKGVVAGMRKLLVLIFVLWKKNEVFNPNYQWGQV